MLKRVSINHASGIRQSQKLSYGLLALGMAAILVIGIWAQMLGKQYQALEQDILTLQQRESDPAAFQRAQAGTVNPTAAKREEIAAVRGVMTELGLPWQVLFQTLESLDTPTIKLLAIEPNPRLRKVRLSAEATDIDGMLAYVDKLAQQAIFSDVFLMSHEQADPSEPMPVHFVVEALWKP